MTHCLLVRLLPRSVFSTVAHACTQVYKHAYIIHPSIHPSIHPIHACAHAGKQADRQKDGKVEKQKDRRKDRQTKLH